jgi:hypothetical protein
LLAHKIDSIKSHSGGGLINGAEFDEGEIFVQIDLTGDHGVASCLRQTTQMHLIMKRTN